MSSYITKKLTVNWPESLSYDTSEPEVKKYFSEDEGITTDRASIFYKKRLLDVFIFAMALGKYKGIRKPLGKKSTSMPTTALRDDEIWLMTNIALTESGSEFEILSKPKDIIKICEEYANAGVGRMMVWDNDKPPGNPLEPYEEHFARILDGDINKSIRS